ncbi:MAG: regulatory protein RecX [Rikenellaceae bacterium]
MNFFKPKIKRIVTPEAALTKLMVLTSKSEKCSGDALRLMARWEIDEQSQSEILKRLISEKWIDDRRFAEAFVRDKSTFSSWGKYKIKNALRTKGIDKETIDDVLEAMNNEDSIENLVLLLKKKKRNTKANSDYELKGKLFRYAMSRGFEYDDITSALNKLNDDDE